MFVAFEAAAAATGLSLELVALARAPTMAPGCPDGDTGTDQSRDVVVLWLDLIVVSRPRRSPAYSPTSFDGAGQASSSPSSFGADSTPSSGAGGQTPAGAYSPSQAAYEPSAPPPDEKEPKKEG